MALHKFTNMTDSKGVNYFITQVQNYKMKFEITKKLQNCELKNPIKKLTQIITDDKILDVDYMQNPSECNIQVVTQEVKVTDCQTHSSNPTETLDCHINDGMIIQIVPDELKAWDGTAITGISIMIDRSKNGQISDQQIVSFSKLYNGLMKKYGFFKGYNVFNPEKVELHEDIINRILNIMK